MTNRTNRPWLKNNLGQRKKNGTTPHNVLYNFEHYLKNKNPSSPIASSFLTWWWSAGPVKVLEWIVIFAFRFKLSALQTDVDPDVYVDLDNYKSANKKSIASTHRIEDEVRLKKNLFVKFVVCCILHKEPAGDRDH